tara:strand:- start:757 stop:1863 length:1107 start_codon:yes stop_codon:yes gene_type:complete
VSFPKRNQIFQDRIDSIKDSVARPSLDTFYQVDFSFGKQSIWLRGNRPGLKRTQGLDFTKKMSLLCTQAEIPGTKFSETTTIGHHQGIQESFPNLRNFPPLNLTFYCDADHVILEVLESWMTYINPVFTGLRNSNAYTRFNYPETYKETIHISKFERDTFTSRAVNRTYRSNITSYEFVNAWPADLTSMRVAYGDSNVLRCSVQFAYDRFFTSFNYADMRSQVINTPQNIVNSKEIQKSTKVVDQETKLASFGDNYKQQEEYFSSQEYKDKVKNQIKQEQANTAPRGQGYGPMASDMKLKENIIKVDNSPSGINIYEWNYIGKSQRYRGVLAQELLESHPEAVTMCPNGFLGVYYGKIDVKMEAVKPF